MFLKHIVCALGAGLLLAPFGVDAQEYTVTDLGTLGGSVTNGYGINGSGQVTGWSVLAGAGEKPAHAFLYSDGTMQDLGARGPAYTSSFGYGINAAGQVTGNLSGADAFHYINGAMREVKNAPGYIFSWGYAINASGEIAGVAESDRSVFDAFRYKGTMHCYHDPHGYSYGYGINDSGQVTGQQFPYAFIRSKGDMQMQDLGTLGGNQSAGYSINNSGQVTGWADTAFGRAHAFLYSNGTMQDLGALGGGVSEGYGINASGQVTGESYTSSGAAHAFVYSDGKMKDLNNHIGAAASLYTLVSGQAINDAGQIVVNGTVTATKDDHAFLLTPTTSISTSTSLTPSASSSTYGASVTLTALVTPNRGPAPTGGVTFYANEVYLGTVTLNGSGQAVLTTNALALGTQTLIAAYSGDPTNLGSTSSGVPVQVTAAATTTSLTASP